jgi:hypothetical protein
MACGTRAFLNFMNSLFHGMDFSVLIRPAPFSWGGFLEALVVMSVWAFLAGTFFGWLRQRLGTASAHNRHGRKTALRPKRQSTIRA